MRKLFFIALLSVLGITTSTAQCTINTSCETVTVEADSGVTTRSQRQSPSTWLLTATSNSTGEIVYSAICNQGGIITASCTVSGGGDNGDNGDNEEEEENSSFCAFLNSIGAPAFILSSFGCN